MSGAPEDAPSNPYPEDDLFLEGADLGHDDEEFVPFSPIAAKPTSASVRESVLEVLLIRAGRPQEQAEFGPSEFHGP